MVYFVCITFHRCVLPLPLYLNLLETKREKKLNYAWAKEQTKKGFLLIQSHSVKYGRSAAQISIIYAYVFIIVVQISRCRRCCCFDQMTSACMKNPFSFRSSFSIVLFLFVLSVFSCAVLFIVCSICKRYEHRVDANTWDCNKKKHERDREREELTTKWVKADRWRVILYFIGAMATRPKTNATAATNVDGFGTSFLTLSMKTFSARPHEIKMNYVSMKMCF